MAAPSQGARLLCQVRHQNRKKIRTLHGSGRRRGMMYYAPFPGGIFSLETLSDLYSAGPFVPTILRSPGAGVVNASPM